MAAGSATVTRKSRDADCCSVNFLKNVLHIFNVIFLLAGCAVLGVGIWTLAGRQSAAFALLSSGNLSLAAGALVLAGSLALAVALLGCCGVRKENRCLILVYTFLLLVVFLLEALVGVLAYVYQNHVKDELRASLNTTFLQGYEVDPARTAAIDTVQTDYRCCGAVRWEDWDASAWHAGPPTLEPHRVPDSCCRSPAPFCGRSHHPSNIYYTGCIYRITDEVQAHLVILGAVGLGICVLQIFGMVLSCCLYIKLKDIID